MLLPADLPIIQALYTKALSADEGQLRPAVAYVLIYEMLFGQVRKLQCVCVIPPSRSHSHLMGMDEQ